MSRDIENNAKETRKLLAEMAKLGGQELSEESIERHGDKIAVPVSIPLDNAADFLMKVHREEEENTEFFRTFPYRPWDGYYCAFNALKKLFGGVSQGKLNMMEGPRLISIPSGPNEYVEVPDGTFTVAQLPKTKIHFGSEQSENGLVFWIHVSAPKKHRVSIQGFFVAVENELKEHSLYKGKAIDGSHMPEFFDTESVDPDQIVYPDSVKKRIESDILTPLRKRQELKALGVEFKRAVLLSGEFGVGKTLALRLASKVAVENGVTFIQVRPDDDLEQCMNTAAMYAPSVVAFEDIDTYASADYDTDRLKRVTELFDGVNAKDKEVMVILTTNYVEKLPKSMLRPGRIDSVITIPKPDHPGRIALCDIFLPDENQSDLIDWDSVSDAMENFTPAFLHQACKRALTYALGNSGLVETEDLILAADSLNDQLALHDSAETHTEKPKLDALLLEMMVNSHGVFRDSL